MVKKVLVFWRDIPSQVILQRGRRREKVLLSGRFQEAIDRAAMRAGKGGSAAYLAEWRRETTAMESDGELRELALAEASRFEEEFTQERLSALIRSHGVSADGVSADGESADGESADNSSSPDSGTTDGDSTDGDSTDGGGTDSGDGA